MSQSTNQQIGSKFLGIEFAPLRIPFERRLETFVVLLIISQFFFAMLNWFTLFYILFYTSYYYLSLLYIAWLIYDRETPQKGARLLKWTRSLKIWKYYTNYFPITLEKTIDLDPNQNYIFGYHPHGIMSNGVFGNFLTDATGFSQLFPGLTTYSVTLSLRFWTPIHREFELLAGIVNCSKESINWLLQKKGKGNVVVIVLGGAQESLDAVPNTMRLTIKNRKGFIKLALENGASVVPVISFGENELYYQSSQPHDSFVRKIQVKIKDWFTFTIPLFHGRGIFQYSIGLLPYRHPIHTIVGKPINLNKSPNPTKEEIETAHAEYIQGLTELFNKHKSKYAYNPLLELEIN